LPNHGSHPTDRDFDAMFVNINSLISRRDLNRLWGIFRTEKHIILERKYKDSPDNEQLQPEPEQESGSEEKHSDQSLLHLQIDSGKHYRSSKMLAKCIASPYSLNYLSNLDKNITPKEIIFTLMFI
jgi:hypothetical protein